MQGASAPCGRRALVVRESSVADTARNLLSTGRLFLLQLKISFTQTDVAIGSRSGSVLQKEQPVDQTP
ncbi:hypothetical protein DT73_25695 [Mangrovibacter sp. MFB070]|nr:hypothetical protein DT73_25695 [Mangrovibacter sp. MFB070]